MAFVTGTGANEADRKFAGGETADAKVSTSPLIRRGTSGIAVGCNGRVVVGRPAERFRNSQYCSNCGTEKSIHAVWNSANAIWQQYVVVDGDAAVPLVAAAFALAVGCVCSRHSM